MYPDPSDPSTNMHQREEEPTPSITRLETPTPRTTPLQILRSRIGVRVQIHVTRYIGSHTYTPTQVRVCVRERTERQRESEKE